MMRSSGWAWRTLRFAMLFFVTAAVMGRFTYEVRAFTTACVAGNWQVAAGGAVDWDENDHPMNNDGDGTYSLTVSIATAGSYEFKVTADCSWAQAFPAGNGWFATTSPNQSVTFHIDTNNVAGAAPVTNAVSVTGDTLPASFTAVGDFQSWGNANPATQLNDQGGGIYSRTVTIPNPGSYQGKVTVTGEWTRQFTATGREIDGTGGGSPTSFTTTAANETVTITLNTNTGRIRFQPNGDGNTSAAQDNTVWWDQLGHMSRDPLYRSPTMAVPMGTTVKLRLRAAANDLTNAQIRIWNDRADSQILANMTRAAVDTQYEYWEYTFTTENRANVYYYRFIAIDGTDVDYYEDVDALGGWGNPLDESQDRSWQLTAYDPAFQTPDWVKNAVIYQIFVDRFRDGNAANNLQSGTFFYGEAGGTINRSLTATWNTPVCDPRANTNDGCEGSYSRNFYGGDLQGVIDQLDYLEDLGVTALYLNPIFESPSNHKYDTRDFSQIDDNFGTLATFQQLDAAAEARGMKIILDGVFNHTSSDSYYFDRYNQYDDNVYGVGACESENSPRVNWYPFFPHTGAGSALCSDDRDYPKWFGIFDSLPVLLTAQDPAQDLIWGDGFNHTWSGVSAPIGEYWIAQGADGWRLDVAPEVDHGVQSELTDGREQFNPYWEEFRKAVHGVNPDAYIVGEEWGLSTSWTSGGVSGGVTFPNGNPGEWDATMNYQFSTTILGFWRDTPFQDNDHNSGSSAGIIQPFSPSMANERLLNLQERYSPEAFAAMMNLFGSHDTSRALFMLEHGLPASPVENTAYPVQNHDWTDAITRLKGAALMQFTLPGAPTIYYGDEVGLVGPQTWSGGKWEDDPYNRQPYPWLDQSGTPYYNHLQSDAPNSARAQLLEHYTTLANTRNQTPALRTGDYRLLGSRDFNNTNGDEPYIVYGRRLPDLSSAAVVFVNRAGIAQSITVNVTGYLPYGATFDDKLTPGVEIYTLSGTGELTVNNIPARGGAILVMNPLTVEIPQAVNLSATSGVSQVTLNWAAVPGINLYRVYRSMLSGGGYTEIAQTTLNTYEDNSVVNGSRYYYVVVTENGSNLLRSEYSNEVQGVPQWSLTTAYRNLQWPFSITHTISTTDTTDDVYGQIYISGGTEAAGAAPGVRAQLGYGPDGTDPMTSSAWIWKDMVFNAQSGNNDEYRGNMLPETIGNFDYTIRYSSDGGTTWFYASERNGGGSPIGDLSVIASSDTTPPSAPTNVAVVDTRSSYLKLDWDASTDNVAVDRYRVFRSNAGANNFSLIATVMSPTTDYTDNTVTANASYDYYVVAVDTSFNLSDPSAAATGTAVNVMIDVTFRVTVPNSTPNETIYIVGNQNVWGPWNPGFAAMSNVGPNTWEATFTFLEGTQLAYKYTRGSWDKVEKQADGNAEVSDRPLLVESATTTLLKEDTVANWRDPYVVSYQPANGTVTSNTNPTISVTWNKQMTPATSFAVTNSANAAVAGSFAYDTGTMTTSFTPTNPLAEGTYTVTVSGQTVGSDTQQVTTTYSFTVDTPPQPFVLQTPANNSVITDVAMLNFVWSASSGASQFQFIAWDNTSTEVFNATISSSSACSGNTCSYGYTPSANGTYTWSVIAKDGTNPDVTASNAPFDFTLNVPPAPSAFTLLTPANGSTFTNPASITSFTWNESTNATSYTLTVDRPTAGDYVLTGTAAADADAITCASAICTATVAGGTEFGAEGAYSWHVLAISGGGTTSAGGELGFTFTVNTPPAAFTLTSPNNNAVITNVSTLSFSWELSNGATGYTLTVTPTAGGSPIINTTNVNCIAAGQGGTCSYTPSASEQAALVEGSYSWTVTATDSTNNTAATNAPFTFTVDFVPQAFNLVTPASNSTLTTLAGLAFTWEQSANANSYALTVRSASNAIVFTETITTCTASPCSYTPSAAQLALLVNGSYTWRVAATDGITTVAATNEPFDFTVNVAPAIVFPLNAGFETVHPTIAGQAANWNPVTVSGDGRICGANIGATGSCAYRFVASAAENSRIQQANTNLTSLGWTTGDTLTLTFKTRATAGNPDFRVRLIVIYQDGTSEFRRAVVRTPSSGYVNNSLSITVTKPVAGVRIQLTNFATTSSARATWSRIFIDDIELFKISNSQSPNEATPIDLIPLPEEPSN